MLAWAFSSKSGGFGSLITLILVSANVFYLVLSWPSVRTSDLLVKTSEKFASASLQLQHLAQEAHSREIEAEKRRIEDAELNEYKLQAAREMLQHFRPKLSLEQLNEAKPQLISYLTNTARSAVASLSPDPVVPAPFTPPAADKALPTNGHVLTPKPIPPARSLLHGHSGPGHSGPARDAEGGALRPIRAESGLTSAFRESSTEDTRTAQPCALLGA